MDKPYYEYIKTRFFKQDKRETEMFTVDFAIKVCPILNKVHWEVYAV